MIQVAFSRLDDGVFMLVSFPQSPDLTLGKVVNAFCFGKLVGKWHLKMSLSSKSLAENRALFPNK